MPKVAITQSQRKMQARKEKEAAFRGEIARYVAERGMHYGDLAQLARMKEVTLRKRRRYPETFTVDELRRLCDVVGEQLKDYLF